MTVSQAVTAPDRTYKLAVALWMGLYVVLCFGAALAIRQGVVPAGPLVFVVAALPSLPIAGMIFSASRFMRDSDEYVRALMSRRIVVATGITFILTNGWGFLEALGGAPHIELYWVFVVFCVLYGTVGRLVRDAR